MGELGRHWGTAAEVKRRVECSRDRVWTAEDFRELPRTAVSQALSRLSRQGEIERVRKGVYYRPRTTAFGVTRPLGQAVIASAVDGSVFPTGTAAAHALGLTTQVVGRPVVATTAKHAPTSVGPALITARRPVSRRLLSATENSVLEVLRHPRVSSDLTDSGTVAQVQEVLRRHCRFPQLASVSMHEPPRVRAILGALGESIGADAASVHKLRQSLNTTTRYRFGHFRALANEYEWGGRDN